MRKETDIQNELSEISRLVAEIPAKNPFEAGMPAGYFEQLPGQILQMIKEDGEEALPETLLSVRHINVYKVEEEYFSQLDTAVKQQIDKDPKIVPLIKRSNAFRYLAAAVIIGILGFTVVNLYINHKEKSALEAENELAIKEAKEILRKGTFSEEMSALNDEDIEGYLAMNGNDVYASLVASSIDEENLPEAEEYIYNDNTLNDFLNELNIDHQTPNNN